MSKFRWTTEILNKHPKRDSLLRLKPSANSQPVVPAAVPVTSVKVAAPENKNTVALPTPENSAEFSFTVPGQTMGKPRQTQSDRWKKRPVVVRYRAYCDQVRACAKNCPSDVYAMSLTAHMLMPASWSKKKKQELNGKLMRQKSDIDNVSKGILDALFEDDSGVAILHAEKYWCLDNPRVDVVLRYFR